MREVLQFQPLYQQRVWGGRRLQSYLGRELPQGQPIGESWEIVDRPEAQSRVRGGNYVGATLRELIEGHAADVMGPGWIASARFPLLVKWLDCSDRLSLQVHPPAEVAPSLGGESKTENWYVAQSVPGASLFVGLKPGVTREGFAKAVATGTAEGCVSKVSVASGDSILVRSGQVHAIDAGNLILEIQQNSDTTYRIYDWERARARWQAATASRRRVTALDPLERGAARACQGRADVGHHRVMRRVLDTAGGPGKGRDGAL